MFLQGVQVDESVRLAVKLIIETQSLLLYPLHLFTQLISMKAKYRLKKLL